jgi:tRNA (adenine22-N1)-methyltransferase
MPNLKRTLSTRLSFVFSKLLPGEAVWDICCDHGYLGIKAHSSGLFSHVHFVDQVKHLIEPLRELFGETAGASFYALPAQDLPVTLRGNVVIAGVGAELICKIMRAQVEKQILQPARLILVPHKDEEKMQGWLGQDLVFSAQFRLIEKGQVEERGRLRDVFIYEPVGA